MSSQDAAGITQKDMGPEFIKNLELYTLERVTVKTTEALAAQGLSNPRVEFAAESTYLEIGGAKLAIVRLRSPDGANQAWIVGIVGKELKRVLCLTSQSATVLVSRGPCGDRIREVFGVSFTG